MEILQKRIKVGGGFSILVVDAGAPCLLPLKLAIHRFAGLSFVSFEILHQDMISFQPSLARGDRVFYFFHPADKEILMKCAENLRRFYEQHRREMVIICHNNLSRDLDFLISFFDDFKREEFVSRGNLFHVFTSTTFV